MYMITEINHTAFIRNLKIIFTFSCLLSDKLLLEGSSKPPFTRLVTVEPLVVFFAASLGAIVAMQAQYIEERLAQDRNYTLIKDDTSNGTCSSLNDSDPDYITQQEIAADLATWSMVYLALMSLPVVFMAPFYGALSDRLGRKLHFAFPIVGHGIFCILLLLVLYLRLSLAVLAFAYFVEGLGGQITFFIAGCYAYISDISTKKARLIRLAVFQTVYFSSAGLIQLPVGYIIDAYGFIPVAWLAVVLHLAAILYLVLPHVLLETVDSDNTSHVSPKQLLQAVYDLFSINTHKRRTRLLLILVIYFFTDIFQLSTGATLLYSLYGLGPPFCWSPITVAYFSVVYLGFSAIGKYTNSLFSAFLASMPDSDRARLK